MRTYDLVVSCSLIGLALGLSPAASFDGTRAPDGPVVAVPMPSETHNLGKTTPLAVAPTTPSLSVSPRTTTPFEALRSGTQALRDGKTDQAVSALEYAAAKGVPGAIWKLGRMYADGEGVDQNKLRAFEYFRTLARAHAYDPPNTQQARFVANAFVALGHFYLEGIPGSEVEADPNRAQEMYRYAASYFGDPDAQYHLGQLYLEGKGVAKEGVQAARWFRRAAEKGHRGAQALLGAMLFKGDGVARQAAMGLFWLTVAKDGVTKDGVGAEDAWITEIYSSALANATRDEQALAYRYLEDWMRNRR